MGRKKKVETIEEPTDEIETEQTEQDEESAYDTAKRIIEENPDSEFDEFDEPVTETEAEDRILEDDPLNVPEAKEQSQPVQEHEPPPYLDYESKEKFKRMPPEGKEIALDIYKRQQQKFTEFAQKASEAERRSYEYEQAASVYLNNNPELIEAGYSGPRLFQEFLATHMELTGKDRSRAAQKYLEIGQKMGLNPQIEGMTEGNNQSQSFDISQHPDFVALQQKADQANSYVEQMRQHEFNSKVNSISQEIEAVQKEKDAQGNLLYPKTHDINFLRQAKPLVSSLAQTMPYSEALKRAYIAIEGQGNLSSGAQAKLPEPTNTYDNRPHAVSAAVSVRGRTNNAPNNSSSMSIPEEALADPYKTAEWYINNRR